MNTSEIEKIAAEFGLDGISGFSALSGGHINRTGLLICGGEKYVLQWINSDIFNAPEKVMRNIRKISDRIRSDKSCGITVPKYITTAEGKNFCVHGEEFCRIHRFIAPEDQPEAPIYRIALSYGIFIKMLSVKKMKLEPTVEYFHCFPRYFDSLKSAERNSRLKKLDKTVMRRLGTLLDTLSQVFTVDFPKRNVHNDAKKDNVILSQPPAVIDLDTAMSGYAALDFGDLVRSVCASGHLDYCALRDIVRGFADGLDGILTGDEICSLYYGILYVTGELAVRYLTDYLREDKYFRNKTSAECLSRADSLLDQLRLFIAEGEEITALIYKQFGTRGRI